MAERFLQMTSSPGFSHLEAVLLFGHWVPNHKCLSNMPKKRFFTVPLLFYVHIFIYSAAFAEDP